MLKNISNKNALSLDNVCYLLTISITQDEIGNSVESSSESMCFCAEMPIASNEFFKAGQTGIKSDKCLLVDSESYNGQEKVKYDGVNYSIYRTYPNGEGFTELYLTKKAGD